ncbi:hypothetical protein OPV22_018166 [Ensete ventricosum]|uniref:Uncharacterized protein n=1 Tax=Ensete ventricosum TaxID=4639 RepID=A0AAV8PFM4_ENSVE|nr:hypothetical protein OPV22_018166 [Ensete ventricosum]
MVSGPRIRALLGLFLLVSCMAMAVAARPMVGGLERGSALAVPSPGAAGAGGGRDASSSSSSSSYLGALGGIKQAGPSPGQGHAAAGLHQ